jgi:hypothetical protein
MFDASFAHQFHKNGIKDAKANWQTVVLWYLHRFRYFSTFSNLFIVFSGLFGPIYGSLQQGYIQ